MIRRLFSSRRRSALAAFAVGGALFFASSCSNSATSPDDPLVVDATDLVVGTGTEAAAGFTVTVDYTGWLYDENAPDHKGTEFGSSTNDGGPAVFPLGYGYVIQGWDIGIVGMRVGGTRRLEIPPELAYGQQGSPPDIPPNSRLVFEVTLDKVQ
ncbi:MAG TPA: FKBP-type peptidyl-prolyl cis-trans isomerase [Vicinamibacterales bacterium]|jgi:FKBP-type peptidyl-prolyl cis-trans isomerase|nr:FKBP-type peptidyl-prolyl cis-trans isomerase [Vicinamibacterales bacterium]